MPGSYAHITAVNIASENRTLARVKDFTPEAIDTANLAMAASIRRNGLSETFRRRQRVAPPLHHGGVARYRLSQDTRTQTEQPKYQQSIQQSIP